MIKSSFYECFNMLQDDRQEWKIKHRLVDILFIYIAAVIANAETPKQVYQFAEIREEWLTKHLGLENGIPSYDTLRRIIGNIDPKLFAQCFYHWTTVASKQIKGLTIAIDGKTLRGTATMSCMESAVHIVNAWASENKMVINQVKTEDKSNEIKAIPELLKHLVIEGNTFSIDAMGCQTDIAKMIVDGKGDYVFGLKGNQGSLHDDVKLFFEKEETNNFKDFNCEVYRTNEKGHGRIEKRNYYYVKDIELPGQKERWAGLKGIGMVIRETEEKGIKRREKSYYISSLSGKAEVFANTVRKHWGIESMHWQLDMIFREDESTLRINHTPENMSLLRKAALNVMKNETVGMKINKRYKKMSLKSKRYAASLDHKFLEALLFDK